MNINKNTIDRNIDIIKRFRPIDDTFFEKLAEDREVCEELLRVILDDKNLNVMEVIPQKSVRNLQGRSVRLDALCTRGDGRICNIEVQRSDKKNHLKRTRYNASCITANIVEPGEDFKNVPDVDIVYISEFDIFKNNKVIYHIEPTITETGDVVDNGLHEVYVNTAVVDSSEVSELMQCFLQTEVNSEKFPKLSKRVYYLKNGEEGVNSMCAISDEIREEGREEGRKETLKVAITRMLKKLSPDEIVEIGYDRELVMGIMNNL